MLGTVEELAEESRIDPDATQRIVDTRHGRLGIRPYRPGLTDPGTAWPGDLDWAALIVYTGDDAHDASEVYVIPGAHFTQDAFDTGGLLQHVDYQGADQPGVFWVDLQEEDSRRARLAAYWIR
ncbi:hypothetical protein [Thermomonospora cellulosilytica]|uniref:Uncharacterized protein n=1 Tax=Thermomonospora cellulosilytica TaxID=1411118 RepID=A0A7W3R7A8_9ACTN|nr:hypothetical protein [Thermomonospora cellulosilytica]MBA9003043.1 hypothetical protein [Thermomonospora cellulosilytica]